MSSFARELKAPFGANDALAYLAYVRFLSIIHCAAY